MTSGLQWLHYTTNKTASCYQTKDMTSKQILTHWLIGMNHPKSSYLSTSAIHPDAAFTITNPHHHLLTPSEVTFCTTGQDWPQYQVDSVPSEVKLLIKFPFMELQVHYLVHKSIPSIMSSSNFLTLYHNFSNKI